MTFATRVFDLADAITTWLCAPNSDSAAMNWMPSMNVNTATMNSGLKICACPAGIR